MKHLGFLAVAALSMLCASASAQSINMRIMSFNTRNCVGMDKHLDFDRTAQTIKDVAPAVVALQELDSASNRYGGHYALGELAKRTQMYATYCPAIPLGNGKYGIGLLSKERPVAVRRYSLPGREEQRALLMVEFRHYYILCTHLSLTEEDARASVDVIYDIVKDLSKPVFIAGDMNSHPDSPTITAFKKYCSVLNNTKQKTYPSKSPKECIDYILSHGCEVRVQKAVVVKDKIASDHRPIYVDITF